MRALDHENIIKLFEVYESEQNVHLILEYLQGGELFQRIKNKGSYSEKDAATALRSILQALDHMHSRGVVHRDLKPENLILASLDSNFEVKIADFGLAQFLPESQFLHSRCGSPGYVAPEVLLDKGYN